MGVQGCDTKTHFETIVAHRTEVGEHLVVNKWRNRHVVFVQHVVNLRPIVIQSQCYPSVPKESIKSNVERLLNLPFQVRIGIAYYRHTSLHLSVDIDNACRSHELHGVVGINTTKVTTQAIADTQFESANEVGQPSLVLPFLHFLVPYNPRATHRREESPTVIATHLRRSVGTGID